MRQNNSWPAERNGIFLRDDVSENYITPFLNDYSEIFQKECSFQFPSSDFRTIATYNDAEQGIFAGQPIEFNKRNVQSIDHISAILFGLRFVYQLVDDITVQPTNNSVPINIRAESRNIALRVIDHLMHEASEIQGFSFETRNWNGLKTPDGGSGLFFAPMVVGYAQIFDHPVISGMSQSEINAINVAIQIDPQIVDFCNSNLSSSNNFFNAIASVSNAILDFGCSFATCRSQIENLANQSAEDGDLVTIGRVELFYLTNLYLKALQSDMSISTQQNTSVTLPVLNAALDLANNTNWDIEFINCDNINPLFVSSKFALKFSTESRIMRIAEHILDLANTNTNIVVAQDGTSLQDNINDDNMHMLLEFLVGSNLLLSSGSLQYSTNEYIDKLCHLSNFEWYAMANKVLNLGNIPSSYDIHGTVNSQLNSAPCEGPWDSPLTPNNSLPTPNTVVGWRAANKLFHPSNSELGIPERSHRGEYSGLDFMVMHNLERIAFMSSSNYPRFLPDESCSCVSEFTNLSYTDMELVVNKKFENYKLQQIVSPSVLAHDLTLQGSAADLIVKNDLTICSSTQENSTTLEIIDGASLSIYGGMKLIIKSGNHIKISDNSSIIAGITDLSFPELGSSCSIILEQNAILELDHNANLEIIGRLQIKMMEGSKLLINNSYIDVSDLSGTSGIITYGNNCLISFTNSTLINNNNTNKFVVETRSASIIEVIDSEIMLFNGGFNLTETLLTASNSVIHLGKNEYNLNHCEILLENSPLFLHDQFLEASNNTSLSASNSNIELIESQLKFSSENEIGNRSTITADNSNIYFNGINSKFILNFATLVIKPDFQMTISSPNGPTGVFEITGHNDLDLILENENSSLTIIGDDKLTETIRVNDYNDLWSNDGNGKIIFKHLLINLNNAGRIWTNSRLEIYDCSLVDNIESPHSGEIEIWDAYMTLQYVDFHKVHIDAIRSNLNIESNAFVGKLAYISLEGGGYRVSRSNFLDGYISSQKLDFISSVSQSTFTQVSGFQDLIACSDMSLVELILTNNSFKRYRHAVLKVGSVLTLRCNLFEENWSTVYAEQSELNMSSTRAAGYNTFINNDYNIEAIYTLNYSLDKGFNKFEPYNFCNIHTVSGMPCVNNQEIFIPANSNIWTTANNIAQQSNGNSSSCQQWVNNNPMFCSIYFLDNSPASTNVCPTEKPTVRPKPLKIGNQASSEIEASSRNEGYAPTNTYKNQSSQLLIETANFDNVPLDSALTYAAQYMEVFDSLGNDVIALELFHEILSSNLDRNNQDIRAYAFWGLEMMKATLENMFSSGSISLVDNVTEFQPPVQKYVDILNLSTDSILTTETFRNQFRIELMKCQLFLTLRKNDIAFEILENLGNCPLDSLELSSLHFWKEKCLHSSLLTEAINSGSSPDSIDTEVSLELDYFINNSNQSNYYFGVTIYSPNSLGFVGCNDDYELRLLNPEIIQATIFPNPAGEYINIKISDLDEIVNDLKLLDVFGRILLHEELNLEGQAFHTTKLPSGLAAGKYFIRITTVSGKSKNLEFIKN